MDRENEPKIVADLVYGVEIAADKHGKAFVLKFDLGSFRRSFHVLPESIRWLLANTPSRSGVVLGEDCRRPDIHPEDWDGRLTPFSNNINVLEFDQHLVLQLTLANNETVSLLLDGRCWLRFMERLWQYQEHLPGPAES